MATEQTGSTGVVLFDGTGVTVTVRVTWSTPPPPTMLISIPDAIFSFFHLSGEGLQATLPSLIGNTDLQLKLGSSIKTAFGASSATITGIQVTSPPVELHSKQVTAILQSGETVRVTLGIPNGLARGPNADELQKVFVLLSSLKFPQVADIANLINKELKQPNQGWDYLVLSLERVSCPC